MPQSWGLDSYTCGASLRCHPERAWEVAPHHCLAERESLFKSNISYCVLLSFQESKVTDIQCAVIVTVSRLLNRVAQPLGQAETNNEPKHICQRAFATVSGPVERKIRPHPLLLCCRVTISSPDNQPFQTSLKLWSLPKYEKLHNAVRSSLIFLYGLWKFFFFFKVLYYRVWWSNAQLSNFSTCESSGK